MKRAFVVFALALTSACAGSSNPAGPTDGSGSLEGTWTGTLSVVARGQTHVGAITVRFSTTPLTGGMAYRAEIRSGNPWLPINNTGDASTRWPGTPPTGFTLSQNYPSPHGPCRADFFAHGQLVSLTHIDADVIGFDNCASDYDGHLVLDKQR